MTDQPAPLTIPAAVKDRAALLHLVEGDEACVRRDHVVEDELQIQALSYRFYISSTSL